MTTALTTLSGSDLDALGLGELQITRDALDVEAARLCSSAEAKAEVRRLLLSYPQSAQPADVEVYAAAMTAEAQRHPLKVLAAACLDLVRSTRFLPSVAELASACDRIEGATYGEMRRCLDERMANLRRIEAERVAREAGQAEAERRQAERVTHQQRIDSGLAEHFGAKVPAWLTCARIWKGSGRGRASISSLETEKRAAEGDAAAFIACRRWALLGCAVAAVEEGRSAESILWHVATALSRGDDAGAEVALETMTDENLWPSQRDQIPTLMAKAVAPHSTTKAARAERLLPSEAA